MRKTAVSILSIFCVVPYLLNTPLAFAETCFEAKGRLFALNPPPDIGACDAEGYSDHAEVCIVFQSKKLEVLKLLQQMDCPSAPSKITWTDHISSTASLIEQMKKYPHGSLDLLDQTEAARQNQINSLDPASNRRRK